MLHDRLRLHVAVTGKTNGRRVGTFCKAIYILSEIEELWKEKHFHFSQSLCPYTLPKSSPCFQPTVTRRTSGLHGTPTAVLNLFSPIIIIIIIIIRRRSNTGVVNGRNNIPYTKKREH
jgi:hypothetical protein